MTTFRSDAAKIVIIGDSTVGKTSLIIRFSEDKYKPGVVATIGVDLVSKIVEIDGKKITIEIWDTAGQERYFNLAASFFHGVSGIIIAYAIDDLNSFVNVEKWFNQVKQNVEEHVCKVLVATKIDLPNEQRAVEKNEGEALAQRLGMNFFETSAQQDKNVQDVFYELTREIKEQILDPRANEQREHQQPEAPVQLRNAPIGRVRQPADDSCRC